MTDQRISRTALMINIALLMSKRSTCRRASVGCIITRNNRIISTGYNGPKSGEPHCDDEHCNINQSCIRSVHAERSAIEFAEGNSINVSGCILYTTSEPCVDCSKLILESGISSVVFFHPYWNSGTRLLVDSEIQVTKFNHEDGVYVK